MKDQIKTVATHISTVASIETGEIENTTINSIKVIVNPDDFCLVYAGFWNVLLSSPLSRADVEMFAYLVGNYSDGTPFTITSYIKKQVSKISGKAETTYHNCTRSLIKNNLIYVVEGRNYKINPRYAFQGSSKDRHKAVIEMVSTCKDC